MPLFFYLWCYSSSSTRRPLEKRLTVFVHGETICLRMGFGVEVLTLMRSSSYSLGVLRLMVLSAMLVSGGADCVAPKSRYVPRTSSHLYLRPMLLFLKSRHGRKRQPRNVEHDATATSEEEL